MFYKLSRHSTGSVKLVCIAQLFCGLNVKKMELKLLIYVFYHKYSIFKNVVRKADSKRSKAAQVGSLAVLFGQRQTYMQCTVCGCTVLL